MRETLEMTHSELVRLLDLFILAERDLRFEDLWTEVSQLRDRAYRLAIETDE